MSLLNYLQFQPIDPDSDKDEINEDHQRHQEIDLKEDIDEANLEDFWNKVVSDIHNDPEWFNFSDD
jgi:hypothetical protein